MDVVFAPGSSGTVYSGYLTFGPRSSWPRRDGLSVLLSGAAGRPLPPTDPMALLERHLATLSESVPRALRGGPRKARIAAFGAPAAGKLRVRVHGWSGKRRLLVAGGERRLAAGERHKLSLTLTPKGRKLLRRTKRSRVKVAVSFTTDAGEVATQAIEYMVKRPRAKPTAKTDPARRGARR